ncbi:proline-rich receptor-like protein kinase PERK10 isoform X1 [Melanotaenia boesemani]|uniref:proline-rich receptor-like protein kinase PERK10 isoform X1 n=1 Tax=Melanotaenia boesemani TaxID=1250792 RepID=UPI001C05A9C6|nr:proline-rich receptor-like protein kinase PERK10 isoform X1 [Melanotaenia boesemani]
MSRVPVLLTTVPALLHKFACWLISADFVLQRPLFSADQPVSHLNPPDTSASFTQSVSGAPPQLLPLQISTQASSWTAPGSETHTLPPSWPDSPGSTVMTSPSPITHHIYPLHSPAPFRALSSPLSFNQWPGFIFPVPSGVFAFPHVPPAQDANNPNPASSHQLTDPKTRTL